MKPLHFVSSVLFLLGVTWSLTRSEVFVREIQVTYFKMIEPSLKIGSTTKKMAQNLIAETKHSKALDQELQILRAELGKHQIFESRFREIEKENQSLRKALNFKQNTKFDVLSARIVRRQPTTWWQTVEIDAGLESKVSSQLSVLSHEGLVGIVDRALKDRSSVLLITDERCQVSVMIEGTKELGILSGQQGKFDNDPILRLRFLSKDASLKPGQKVYTTGRGGLFHPNILVGSIVSIEKGTLDSEALVKPAVSIDDLDTVFVVISEKSLN